MPDMVGAGNLIDKNNIRISSLPFLVKPKVAIKSTTQSEREQSESVNRGNCQSDKEKIEKLLQEAQSKLEAADQKAQSIITEARQQAERIEQQAYNRGKEQGYKEGMQKALDEYKEKIDMLESALSELRQQREEYIMEWKEESKLLALQVARKIISDTVVIDDQAFESMYRKAISNIGSSDTLSLKVSKNIYKKAVENAGRLLEISKDVKELNIELIDRDDTISMIIETPELLIDAGLDSQLEKIGHAIINSQS